MLKKNFIYFGIITFIFFLDRITKILVVKTAQDLGKNDIYFSDYINIELVWNKGVAFGLFSMNESTSYNLITLVIFFVILIIIFLILKAKKFEKFSYILILGGALGNLFDRLLYKAVPDFIDLHINNFHWFIFNIADIFITMGVMCLIFVEIFFKKET